MSYNDITGDKLKSKIGNTNNYSSGYDAIFGKGKLEPGTQTENCNCEGFCIKEHEDEPNKVDVPYNWVCGWKEVE